MRKCEFLDCGNKHHSRGWCVTHYARWLRHGTTLLPNPKDASTEDIVACTKSVGDCLLWTRSTTVGYATRTVEGKKVYVHRQVYEDCWGHIPEGMFVDHTCHNRSCVSLGHLRLATNKQNQENRSGPPKNNTSGYRNVSWDKSCSKWLVNLGHDGTTIFGGLYQPYELHVAAYHAKKLRLRYHTYNVLDR